MLANLLGDGLVKPAPRKRTLETDVMKRINAISMKRKKTGENFEDALNGTDC